MTTEYVNQVTARNGRLRAVCQFCGRKSKPTKPDSRGEPEQWEMGRGWTQAPYPRDFKHDDGSLGSTWACPRCEERLRAGETLQQRNYGPGVKPATYARHIA